MTGKDLIIYILENDLEDKSIIDENGIPIWLMTVYDAAVKMNVGISTILTKVIVGEIPSVTIGDTIYIQKTN